jgi:hypothetical protein
MECEVGPIYTYIKRTYISATEIRLEPLINHISSEYNHNRDFYNDCYCGNPLNFPSRTVYSSL